MVHSRTSDPLEKRKLLMNEVIVRHCRYGDIYDKAIREFNEKFPMDDSKTNIIQSNTDISRE